MSFAFNRGVGSKKIGMQFSFDIPVTMHFQKFSRPASKIRVTDELSTAAFSNIKVFSEIREELAKTTIAIHC